MPAKTTQAVEEPEVQETSVPKVLTNYSAFAKAHIIPVEAVCQSAAIDWGYAKKMFHNATLGCHSRINLKTDKPGQDLIQHLDHGHSGGFIFKFRPVRDGVWAGWKTLIENGIEIANLNCGVCNQDVLMHPQHIAKHMKRHLNGNRHSQKGGSFRIAFTKDAPVPQDELDLLPKEDFDFMDGEWDE